MQTVLLEIISGPQTNQRIWVRLGQIVRLGSGEHADVVIDSDRTLDPLHVSVGHSRAGCFVERLDPADSITVNGKKVQRSRLHHGDLVVAGETEFKAILSSESGEPAEPSSAASVALPADPATSEPADGCDQGAVVSAATDFIAVAGNKQSHSADVTPDRKFDYEATRISDALWQLSAESPTEFSPDEIIGLLAVKYDCFVCGDSSVFGKSDATALEHEHFRQLNEDVAIQQLSGEEVASLFASPEACQAASIIFSSQSLDSVSQSVARHLFSFRRPNIFATQISVATSGVARKLLGDLVAVLIINESQYWQLFTSLPIDQSWQELGLPNQPRQSGQ